MSKKRETQLAEKEWAAFPDDLKKSKKDVDVAEKEDNGHATFLHLQSVYEPNLPYVFRYDSEAPLTSEQVKLLGNSTPTTRAESDVSLPGYDPVEDAFDVQIWVPLDLSKNAVIESAVSTTNIYGWLDE